VRRRGRRSAGRSRAATDVQPAMRPAIGNQFAASINKPTWPTPLNPLGDKWIVRRQAVRLLRRESTPYCRAGKARPCPRRSRPLAGSLVPAACRRVADHPRRTAPGSATSAPPRTRLRRLDRRPAEGRPHGEAPRPPAAGSANSALFFGPPPRSGVGAQVDEKALRARRPGQLSGPRCRRPARPR